MPEPFRTGPGGPGNLPFIELQSVDSTNNYARALITEGLAQHGMTVFAWEQLAGKGQRGHSWSSEKGANIMMSMLLEAPPFGLTEQFRLNAAISLAVYDFFSKYAGDQTRIKWPNDLYWQDRKAGGILIENIIGGFEGRGNLESGIWKWAIVGIGININQVRFPEDLKNPVSLKQITGKDFDPVTLAKELVLSVQKTYGELLTGGFGHILELYNHYLYKKYEVVRLKKDNIVFEAAVRSVSPNGKLIIQHGVEEEIDFGNIEWLIL